MRLIDADALLEKLIKTPRYFDLKFDIDNAPTIDAEPVVRCKDCRYWNNRHSGVTYCHRLGVCMTKADDYCCFGERREDG